MYGLPQAGIISHRYLSKHLNKHRFHVSKYTLVLWLHEQQKISFILIVDDFGVKFVNLQDVQYLIDVLHKKYEVTIDWTGSRYAGLTLKCNYKDRIVDLSLPNYIAKALKRFNVQPPSKPVHATHHFIENKRKDQTPIVTPTERILPAKEIKLVQQIIRVLLFYSRAVNVTLVETLNNLLSRQSKATKSLMQELILLLQYLSTHHNATIRYVSSKMVLHIDTDASYLSLPNARSKTASYFYLIDRPGHPNKPLIKNPNNNGPLLVKLKNIKYVVSSAAESEIVGVFEGCQEGIPIR